MRALLAYGSLIHPDEHGALPGLIDATPVRVEGFRRIFHQTPSWRRGEGRAIAVLDALPSSEDSINAVCLLLEDESFELLTERERGYRLHRIPSTRIRSCSGDSPLPSLESFHLYQGRQELRDETLLPNPDYLNLCLEGAKAWGEEFYRRFIATTFLADGSKI